MSEHFGQHVEPELEPFNHMGKPIPAAAREEGYRHCKKMGLSQARARECVNGVSEQLERDKPYEAQAAGMKFLDLTGTYRLFAVLLCAAARLCQEAAPEVAADIDLGPWAPTNEWGGPPHAFD